MEPAEPTSTLSNPPPSETPVLENDEAEYGQYDGDEYLIPKPSEWFPKLVSFQADLIYNCMATLSAPIFSLLSVASDSYHQVEQTKDTVESAVHQVPSTLTHCSTILLKKLGFGFLGAAYVCMEPVFVRDRMHFDYTDPHPTAVFAFGGVPVGHTFYVSLVLLMPESDFNRGIGVFQMSAELLSVNGDVIAKSSQPCMLRFRSLPVRLSRTFLMGVPLLLGISAETQKLTIQILEHKEGHFPRTQAIRVTLFPRAGTSYLPQLYEAEILLNSQLPWTKHVVRSWKLTFVVWTALYIYVLLLIILILFCKPLLLPMTMITATAAANVSDQSYIETQSQATSQPGPRPRRRHSRESQAASREVESEDVQELLRKWQRSRSKRKAMYLQPGDLDLGAAETIGSSAASTISITREDASVAAEDVGDSESVC
ncbi:seipin-1 [Prunus yedoensis var. nudiflora]|uniref:Seipin-1 n=1 Tax=Prunus yedoensis var. nudiflora TaxID=2094558 RepID=A0A314Z817_PRUYE|nr:seipin-1 [Prunus yedoensis var. nudiflora]